MELCPRTNLTRVSVVWTIFAYLRFMMLYECELACWSPTWSLSNCPGLYLFAGWNGKRALNDLHVLDVASGTWSEVGSLGFNFCSPSIRKSKRTQFQIASFNTYIWTHSILFFMTFEILESSLPREKKHIQLCTYASAPILCPTGSRSEVLHQRHSKAIKHMRASEQLLFVIHLLVHLNHIRNTWRPMAHLNPSALLRCYHQVVLHPLATTTPRCLTESSHSVLMSCVRGSFESKTKCEDSRLSRLAMTRKADCLAFPQQRLMPLLWHADAAG